MRSVVWGLVLLLGVGLGATACTPEDPDDPRGRLWLSALPTDAKQNFTGFFVVEVRGQSIGMFQRGSAYSGRYDLFRWHPTDEGAVIEWLQSERRYAVKVESCEPDTGFDRCLLLHGDPTRTVRYQSRKRWRVKLRDSAKAPSWQQIVNTVAAQDPAIEVILDPSLDAPRTSR